MSNGSNVVDYVEAMCKGFASNRAGGLDATYHLQLSGAGGGDWTVSVANGRCRTQPGRPSRADTQITMSTDSYLKLAAGRLNIRSAFQQGQIRIGGNQQLALKFAEIFPAWESHVQADASDPTPPVDTRPAETEDTPTLADYVRTMPNGFRPQKVGNLRATYQFNISGTGGGTWTVDVSNGTCSVSKVTTDAPNVVIDMSDKNFIKLAEGRLNTTQAYRQGQIKIRGDLNLAAKIPDIFGAWADTAGSTPFPTPPAPSEPTQPKPEPTQPKPIPVPESSTGPIYPNLMNGSFDEYQPYIRKGEAKVWKEDRFPEQYGKYWTLQTIREKSGRRFHIMDSGVFGKFTQRYFGGGGRDYHIHGRHSQVITSRYEFDLVLHQTITAQPGKAYTFSGAMVSFFKGTSGAPVHGKIFKTIGIDPTGGRDHEGANVVWGDRDGRDNEWRYPSLTVEAQAQAITVFIRLENEEDDVGQTELNIIHLDNFTLK